MSRLDGTMAIIIGVSRSGKSLIVKRVIAQRSRVLVFDPKGEYAQQFSMQKFQAYEKEAFLKAVMNAGPKAKISFAASDPDSFQFFCDCAFNFNRQAPSAIVCEELASVTNASKAKGAWGRLINQGLAYQPLIIGTVQRGQEVDKTILNNASFVHVARHNSSKDVHYIADMLDVPESEIPRRPLQFFQWTSDKGIVCRGTIQSGPKSKLWPKGKPKFVSTNGRLLEPMNDGHFKGVKYK